VQDKLQTWITAASAGEAAEVRLNEADLTALLRATADPNGKVSIGQGTLYVELATPRHAVWQAIISPRQRSPCHIDALRRNGRATPTLLRLLVQAAANTALRDLVLPLRVTGARVADGYLTLTAEP